MRFIEIATQVGGALMAAHQAGIVHRDIKPENIMLRRDGYVKVLDFGLAKLTEQHEPTARAQAANNVNISSGLVMGTVKYMSPEQARGGLVDPRSDIFSFGVVLYEMIAGRGPFEGATSSELIAAILKKDPPPLTNVPDEIQRLVSRTLQKRKEGRYQTIQDFLVDLKGLRQDHAVASLSKTAPQSADSSELSTIAVAPFSTASSIESIVSGIKRHKTSTALILVSLALAGVGMTLGLNRLGSRLRASPNQMKMARIPDTERASGIAISPDGKFIAQISISGGKFAIWLSELPNGTITSGERDLYRVISWTPDGRILYPADTSGERDIWIMNADGTNPKQLTANAGKNLQPQASPDGHYIFFSSNRGPGGALNIWRMDLDGSNPIQLTHGSGEIQPDCSPDGRWVVYSQGGPDSGPDKKTVWKVPFDGSEPIQLTDKPSNGAAISPDGTLIACWYKQDAASPWKIAMIPFAGGPPIKILDATRTSIFRLRWAPDGQAISYINTREGVSNIWSQPISDSPPKQVTKFTSEQIEGFDWSRDGTLVCSRVHSAQDVVLISDFK